MLKQYRLVFAAIVSVGLFTCCKKEKSSANTNPPPTNDSIAAADRVKDTVLLNTKDIYLWYDQIPASFNARSYADPDKIMQAIRQYSIEPGFTSAVDKWSFGMKKTDWDNLSSGVSGDFGFSVFFLVEGDLRVKYVESTSPAGLAGIHRGWKITKINGSTNITTSNSNFIVQNVFYSSQSSFTFQKPDGTTTDITLNATTYQSHPIFLDSVYTAGTNKVGYLVFNSFLGDTTQIYNSFQTIFSRFASKNVSDVIVDLRYNGGGYVSVQEKLADYLVNNSGNGNVMMKQQYNNKYSQYNQTTNFNKLGSLNLSRIFFIVSHNTASASELLINNLKPYMNVKLVGPSNTYGKPVGFFPIPVGDWYIFPVSFRSTNSSGVGNYFNGIAVDSQQPDGLDKDWGDVNESALASVIKYLNTGSFNWAEIQGQARASMSSQIQDINSKLDVTSFKGAVMSKNKFR